MHPQASGIGIGGAITHTQLTAQTGRAIPVWVNCMPSQRGRQPILPATACCGTWIVANTKDLDVACILRHVDNDIPAELADTGIVLHTSTASFHGFYGSNGFS